MTFLSGLQVKDYSGTILIIEILQLLARPLLIGAGAAGPLDDIGPISGSAVVHIGALATVAGFELEVAADGDPLPLLVCAGAAGPLDDICIIGGGSAVHIQAFATVAVDDPEIAAACILELPLLV